MFDGKTFAAVFVTLVVGYLAFLLNPELGTIAAIAIMGGFILSELKSKSKWKRGKAGT